MADHTGGGGHGHGLLSMDTEEAASGGATRQLLLLGFNLNSTGLNKNY